MSNGDSTKVNVAPTSGADQHRRQDEGDLQRGLTDHRQGVVRLVTRRELDPDGVLDRVTRDRDHHQAREG